jgi:hypothetical protein
VDYERVLSSDMLTPRDRQVCAMYLCNLDQAEMGALLGISQQTLSKCVDKCLRHLLAAIKGKGTSQPQRLPKRLELVDPAWDTWMLDVLYNRKRWWNVPDSVRRYIQRRFGIDGLACEREDYEDANPGKEYPFHRERYWYGIDQTFPDYDILIPYRDYIADLEGPKRKFAVRLPSDNQIIADRLGWRHREERPVITWNIQVEGRIRL